MDLLKSTIPNSIPLLSFIPKKGEIQSQHIPQNLWNILYILRTFHFFILGGSLCEDLELFNSFKISPRSLKSEFICKNQARFSIEFLLFIFWTDVRWILDVRSLRRTKLVERTVPTKITVSRQSVALALLIEVRQSSDVRSYGRPKLNGCPKLAQPDCPNGHFDCWAIYTPLSIRQRVEQHIEEHIQTLKGSLSFLPHQILDIGVSFESSERDISPIDRSIPSPYFDQSNLLFELVLSIPPCSCYYWRLDNPRRQEGSGEESTFYLPPGSL